MLKERIQKLLEQIDGEIFEEEKEYIEKNGLLPNNKQISDLKVNEPSARFSDVYIERSLKETDELISTEAESFLDKSVNILKENMAEFLYIESKWFDVIGIDAISLEVDDVFGTYEAMFGLKLKKNVETKIREYVKEKGIGETPKYNLMFNQQDGLWDMNLTLNDIKGFDENMSIGEVLRYLYKYLFQLVEKTEKK
ncbi:hypothetical protein [Metabacillus halosaccharovorans]|uniref:hypothetical protein n=1 Tax=Metabacillus halosaccharovorans TaxID=930124 RepID=UPI00099529B0|nr:hypothetical protein [Metabacillus halosaccharovorans]